MPSPSLHITLYEWLTPFLETAKSKGFSVSPDTHLQIFSVLHHRADTIEDETALFDYISPLIAKSKEDYLLLKDEYDKWCGREKPPANLPPKQKKKWPYIVATTGISLLLIVLAIFLTRNSLATIQADYNISYTDVTRPVQFNASGGFENNSDTANTLFIWNFGDGTIDTSMHAITTHTYATPDSYHTSLTLLPRSSHIQIRKARLAKDFTLCKPSFSIQQTAGELVKGGQVVFSVSYDSLYAASGNNLWQVNGKTVQENNPSLTWQFDSAGTYQIVYIDKDYNKTTGCDTMTETSVSVKAPSTLSFNISQTGNPIAPPAEVSKLFQYIVFAIMGLTLLISYLLKRKNEKEGDKKTAKSSSILARLKGSKAPYEIPFANHEDVIDDEPLTPLLAKGFRHRVNDENLFLNVPLTISGALHSEGFLVPVFSAKTKPSEYLILIDKKEVKSSAVKLFEFLVKRFAKSDIYIELFYFYDKPDYCFNAYYSKGIYITLLYDLYPDHTLIVFGNGYTFIDKYYPALNDALVLPFTRWNQHAIFTPVPYADWSSKEKLLQHRFLLLPADLEGQLLLFNFIDKPETYGDESLQHLQSLYKTKGINVNKAEKIKKYLDDDFLFQWLCAMAISPSIHWQTLLGIGEALQKERYHSNNIQYSSLLKLVRIKWMNDASFPEEVRLELLKALEPQNEKIARQTMIRLMDEALLKTDENSFAYEELYMQQMTDKFMLYASNATDIEFKNYKENYDQFKTLWREKKFTDVVLKEYLQKENGGKWSTLIGNKTLSEHSESSIGIDTLFGENIASKSKLLRRLWYIEGTVLMVCALAIILVSIFKNQLNSTSFNQSLHLVSVDNNAMVPFSFAILNNQCLNSSQRQKDSAAVTLDFGNNNTLLILPTDTSKQKSIPYTWLGKQAVGIHLSSLNAAYNFDTTVVITSNQMSLSVNGCAVYCNTWQNRQTNNLDTAYNGDWYENSIVNGSGSTYTSIHVEPNSINSEKIEKIETCENNSGLLRIITQNNDKAFSLYYLLQTDANIISFAVQGTSYETINKAERDTTGFDMTTRIRLISNNASFVNSQSFFASSNGRWLATNDTDFIDIPATQNIITVNGKNNFTVLFEQQTKTSWGKPVYKITVAEKKSTSTDTAYLYFLLLDSSKAMVDFEEHDTARTSHTLPAISLFEPLHKRNSNLEKPAALPQSLNEIWHGGSSNRLMTLFLPGNVIYYSVNDTKTFGTYNINAASLLSDGTYKIVTKTDQGYKLFFIKNVTSTSFDLSVCQNFLTNKEEANGKTAANCDHFNTMSLYYENDPSFIYFPVSFSNNLVASQQAKLNKVAAAINSKTATVSGFDVRLSYSPPKLSNTFASLNSFLQKNGISDKIKNSDVNSSVTNQPFTRSYIEIKTALVAKVSANTKANDYDSVKQGTSTETNLGNIQVDEKSGAPDNTGLQLITAIAKQLNNDTASRVKLTGYYQQQADYKMAQQHMNTVLNLFRKSGVAVSRANMPLHIDTAITQMQPVQQQQTKSNVISVSSINVSGINFPANFNAQPAQKKY